MDGSSAFAENRLVFRQIKKEEVPLLADLYAASFPDKAPFLPFEMGIVNENDSYAVFDGPWPIAMVTANPVTFKGAKGHQIFKLCAHKDYRGKGVARALVIFMHEEQKKKGDRFSLVMPGGEKLYAFYENCGYWLIAARKQMLLPGDTFVLPEDLPCYTNRYQSYCKKSAKANGKLETDAEGAFWGLERDGLLFVDDFFGHTGVLKHPSFVYLPDQSGTDRYGMVCPFDDETDVKDVFLCLVNGFH